MSTESRYLEYGVAVKQSQPQLRANFPVWLKELCDDGVCVVFDTKTHRRYYCGQWTDVPVVASYPGTPLFCENLGDTP